MKGRKYLVIGLVIVLVLGLGCIDSTSQKSGIDNIPITSSDSATKNKDMTSTDDDMIFLSWKLEVSDVLKDDLVNAIDALQNRKGVAIKGKILKEDSQKYLDKLNKLNVSPKYKPSYDEYKKAIENYLHAGEYMESETTESNGMALSNIDQGTKHLGEGNRLSPKPNNDTDTKSVATSQPITISPTKTDVHSETGITTNVREEVSGNNVKLYVQINNKELIKEYNKADTSGIGNIERYIAEEIKGSYKDKKPIKIYYINGNEITTVGIVSGDNKIKISSQPSNADVYIEDIYKGKTPLEVDPVSETYSLTVKLEGYQTRYSTIGPDTAEITIYLQPNNPNTQNVPNSQKTIQPITLSGRGQKASDKFNLPQELVRFEMTHDGTSNFAIWLLDSQGNKKELLVNEIGKFQGSKAVGIKESGDYLLDINADGNWNIKIESVPVMSSTPSTLSGRGQKATNLFYLNQGLAKFDMTHDGKSNFAIWLLDNQGNKKELLVNEIGKFQGSKAVGIKESGNYLLDIDADGNWNINIS